MKTREQIINELEQLDDYEYHRIKTADDTGYDDECFLEVVALPHCNNNIFTVRHNHPDHDTDWKFFYDVESVVGEWEMWRDGLEN
jgi:hypothetical protein